MQGVTGEEGAEIGWGQALDAFDFQPWHLELLLGIWIASDDSFQVAFKKDEIYHVMWKELGWQRHQMQGKYLRDIQLPFELQDQKKNFFFTLRPKK